MQVDRSELGKHFASLNDEELLNLKQEDLTVTAQEIYALEMASRRLTKTLAAKSKIEQGEASFTDRNRGSDDKPVDPDWHHDGVLVSAFADQPGSNASEKTSKAQASLHAAGIPSHLRVERKFEESFDTMEVLVPIQYAMHATSILDRDVINDEFEAYWRDHLGMLSNEDLLMLDPDVFCAGMLDRVERLKKAYSLEISKRKLKAR
jgi:hypothetical protein